MKMMAYKTGCKELKHRLNIQFFGGRGARSGGGGSDNSLGTVELDSEKEMKLAELREELENTKGLLAKSRIRTQIEMLENDFEGTREEWLAKKREENDRLRAEAVERAKAEEARAEALKQARAEQSRIELETEMRTQPREKVEQFEIIQENNPMRDDYHVGIRKPSDIKTWNEVMESYDGESFNWGDFSRADGQKALETGKITIYSSYPIKQGVFVSTSRVQSEQYAGGAGKKLYSKTVSLSDVAWINGDEGQFAKRKKKK